MAATQVLFLLCVPLLATGFVLDSFVDRKYYNQYEAKFTQFCVYNCGNNL